MKYWLFQNNQVTGPFEGEQLAQAAGFSADSLVCPEGRKGTQMGDWQRAGIVPDLADVLLRSTRVSALARAGSGGAAGAAMLPPEPTLRDLAVLGSLQEKVAALEGGFNSLQEDLRHRDTEISRLKVELDQRTRAAFDLQGKVADLEVKVIAHDPLQAELNRAKDDARIAAARQESLERQLAEVQARLEALASRPLVAPAPSPMPSFAPQAAPAPLAELTPTPAPSEPPAESPRAVTPSPDVPSLDIPALAPPLEAPKTMMGQLGSLESIEMPPPNLVEEPLKAPDFGGIESGADVGAGKKGKPIVAVVVLLAGVATAGVYLVGGKGKRTAHRPSPAAPSAPAVPTPAAAGGEEADSATDQTEAAVVFVKNYKVPGGEETIQQKLESRYPAGGGLSPWMVEKLEGDKYQVNFYSSKPDAGTGRKLVFEFQARVRSKILQGLNAPAIALLNGEPLPAPGEPGAPRRRRRGRRAAQRAEGSPAPAGGPVETPGGTVLPPEPSDSQAPRTDEEMTLDQLLLPGADKPAAKKGGRRSRKAAAAGTAQ